MEETGLTEKLLEFAGKGMDALPGAVRTITCIAVLIIPLVMLFAGILGLVCPPKEANWHIGYRSRRIMRSRRPGSSPRSSGASSGAPWA